MITRHCDQLPQEVAMTLNTVTGPLNRQRAKGRAVGSPGVGCIVKGAFGGLVLAVVVAWIRRVTREVRCRMRARSDSDVAVSDEQHVDAFSLSKQGKASVVVDNRDIRIIVGENIRRLRTDKGWTQTTLAARSNLHRTYIGDIERGTRNVSVLNVDSIAAALGVPAAELLQRSRILPFVEDH